MKRIIITFYRTRSSIFTDAHLTPLKGKA